MKRKVANSFADSCSLGTGDCISVPEQERDSEVYFDKLIWLNTVKYAMSGPGYPYRDLVSQLDEYDEFSDVPPGLLDYFDQL
jgi:hypothetical protein